MAPLTILLLAIHCSEAFRVTNHSQQVMKILVRREGLPLFR
jgi:hypothetical protein